MGWNGTRLKTSWLRLRGNAAGRRRPHWAVKFFCDGCQRHHGHYVERTSTLDKLLLCNRQYYRHLDGKPFFKTTENSI
jgi:ribosomal protein L44E